jgi:hypothetical protein
MRIKTVAGLAATILSACLSQSARSDQWVTALTPTSAQVSNVAGTMMLYITTTQTVANPAGCPAGDGYVVSDPKIADEALAMALTAITASHTIQVYVSSSQCANSRPMVLDFQINW